MVVIDILPLTTKLYFRKCLVVFVITCGAAVYSEDGE